MFPHVKITDKDIQAAKPKRKSYKLSAGGALYIMVTPTGSKYWRLKYRLSGKEKTISFGVFPTITLKEAITARDEARRLIKSGIDPIKHRKEQLREKIITGNKKKILELTLYDNGEISIAKNEQYLNLTAIESEALHRFLSFSLPNKDRS